MTEAQRTEVRDGKVYRVTVLPEQRPPGGRSKKTRFHYRDVAKGGAAKKKRNHRNSVRIRPKAKFPFAAVINGRKAKVYAIGDVRYE